MRAATLGSAGCLTHTIACNLHSHEPLSGFLPCCSGPSHPVCATVIFFNCILLPLLHWLHLVPTFIPPCTQAMVPPVCQCRGTVVQGYWDKLTPIPFSLELCSHHQLHPTTESSVQAFLPSMAVPLPLILFFIFQNILSSEAILLDFGSGPSHYWVPWQ